MDDDLRTRAVESIRRLHAFDGLPAQLAPIYDAAIMAIAEYERSLEEGLAGESALKEARGLHQEIRDAGMAARAASRRRLATADKEALLSHTKQMGSSPLGILAEDITDRLRHMNRTLQAENERAAASMSLLQSSSRRLMETSNAYQAFAGLVSKSKTLMTEVSNLDRNDRLRVQLAFTFLLLVVAYVFVMRAPVPTFFWPWNWVRWLFSGGAKRNVPIKVEL